MALNIFIAVILTACLIFGGAYLDSLVSKKPYPERLREWLRIGLLHTSEIAVGAAALIAAIIFASH